MKHRPKTTRLGTTRFLTAYAKAERLWVTLKTWREPDDGFDMGAAEVFGTRREATTFHYYDRRCERIKDGQIGGLRVTYLHR